MTTRTALCRLDGAWARTDEGFLDAQVNPTRAGVFRYWDGERIIKELRPPSEVFDEASLKSLENKPHTNEHPPSMLSSRNAKKYSTGHVYGTHTAAMDGVHTVARVMVTDEEAIQSIHAGKIEVSCGYTCDVFDEPGEFDGEKYDRVQKNIRYNHLASVTRGRAGNGAKLKLDRFDALEVNENWEPNEEKTPMIKKKIGEHEAEVSEAAAIALDSKDKMDAALIAELQAKTDAAIAERDSLQAKLDAAQEQIEQLKAVDISGLVQSLASIQRQAAPVLGQDFKFDGLSEVEIKKAVIAAKRPAHNLESRSDEYISTYYEAIIDEPAHKQADSLGSFVGARADACGPAGMVDKARKDMMKRYQDMWKEPLGKSLTNGMEK